MVTSHWVQVQRFRSRVRQGQTCNLFQFVYDDDLSHWLLTSFQPSRLSVRRTVLYRHKELSIRTYYLFSINAYNFV